MKDQERPLLMPWHGKSRAMLSRVCMWDSQEFVLQATLRSREPSPSKCVASQALCIACQVPIWNELTLALQAGPLSCYMCPASSGLKCLALHFLIIFFQDPICNQVCNVPGMSAPDKPTASSSCMCGRQVAKIRRNPHNSQQHGSRNCHLRISANPRSREGDYLAARGQTENLDFGSSGFKHCRIIRGLATQNARVGSDCN